MSQESLQWLNQNVLIGYSKERGHAWHYRASDQGAEPNHYTGPIPAADVRRRLFNWEAVPAEVLLRTHRHGVIADPDSIGLVASDTGERLGIHAKRRSTHQYQEWLLEKVEALLDGGLAIGSAGLLNKRRQAWVSIEVPDTVSTPEGVEFRPFLLAATSHDASLATTYKRTVINTVCDNTMGAALAGSGQIERIKHTKNAALRFNPLTARKALDLVQVTSDEFAAEIRHLCRIDVRDRDWRNFLHTYTADTGTRRSQSLASTKRTSLQQLWDTDQRVMPWRNTAFGVLQAVNTYSHHMQTVRNVSRAERNMSDAVTGEYDKLDQRSLSLLDTILAAA